MKQKRTELQLRQILDSALDSIISMDHHGKVVEFNRAAEVMFGIARADALGKDVGDLLVPPKYRTAHQRGLERYLTSGEMRVIGDRIRTTALRADGTEFPCELSVTLSTATAQPVFTAYIRDVTEQEEAEEALRQSQRTLMTLMSNLPGMAYRCPEDQYGTMQYISEGCVGLTGYDLEDLIANHGVAFPDLIHPEDHDRVLEEVRRALNAHESFQVHYRIRTANGEVKWANDRGRGVYSVFSPMGDPIAIEGFITDITERKRAEVVLSEYSQRLEAEVAERTQEVNARNDELRSALDELHRTHDQLITQDKLASLGALTAGIAHEIKNPLNFVNNFAEISVGMTKELSEILTEAKDAIGDARFTDITEILGHLTVNAQKIREHGRRADSILRSMLLHSRSSSGDRQLTDLNALLNEELNLAYHAMRARDKTFNVEFVREFDPAVGEIAIVPQDIGRVFLNIVNNACQAIQCKRDSEPGAYHPAIVVTTRACGDHVEVRIRDNGTGIAKDVLPKVFDPFFTTKPAGEGTGLGLSISYEIVVQKHGGGIEVSSEPGEYAEFVITLPRKATRD